MKAGIYFSGLGQSFNQESVEKYTSRLANEMRYANGKSYSCHVEKIKYADHNESTVVSIYEGSVDDKKIVYKMYDFNYYKSLTSRFEAYNILKKNFFLLLLVVKKFPISLWRMIRSNNYSHRFQSFYVFTIFFVLAMAIIISVPSALALVTEFFDPKFIHTSVEFIKNTIGCEGDCLSGKHIRQFTELAVSATAIMVFIVPHAKNLILNLATEFVCASNYMDYGDRRQVVQGNLELLIAYIHEHDMGCKIHFHSYSFGSLIAIDYLFPIGHTLSSNARNVSESLITIATPVEFVKAYYSGYFKNRSTELDGKIKWLNVYSVSDALATNFRKDTRAGEAHFGLINSTNKPVNLNYEIRIPKNWNPIDFLTFYPIRVHGMYWDPEPSGQSSLRLVYQEMVRQELL